MNSLSCLAATVILGSRALGLGPDALVEFTARGTEGIPRIERTTDYTVCRLYLEWAPLKGIEHFGQVEESVHADAPREVAEVATATQTGTTEMPIVKLGFGDIDDGSVKQTA